MVAFQAYNERATALILFFFGISPRSLRSRVVTKLVRGWVRAGERENAEGRGGGGESERESLWRGTRGR
jgi:hypothetical protein